MRGRCTIFVSISLQTFICMIIIGGDELQMMIIVIDAKNYYREIPNFRLVIPSHFQGYDWARKWRGEGSIGGGGGGG